MGQNFAKLHGTLLRHYYPQIPYIPRPAGGVVLTDNTSKYKEFIVICNTKTHYTRPLIGTQEIRFGRKTDEIAKFNILDEKTKFTILVEIWTKNGQLIDVIAEKSCQILPHSLALP